MSTVALDLPVGFYFSASPTPRDECLWKFHYESDYGFIDGAFIASEREMDLVFGKQSRTICLGEALGKNSEVFMDLKKSDFTKLPSETIPRDKLDEFCLGYNPLELFRESIIDEMPWEFRDDPDRLKEYLQSQNLEELFDIFYGRVM
jgi:hypothetical protein